MNILFLFLANGVAWLRNGWRQLRRQRLDWVRMTISGGLPEIALSPPWWQRRFVGARAPLSLSALRRRFERIADDPQIHGVCFTMRDLEAGWASLQSLHDAMGTLRAAGKRIVIYLPAADTRTYFAACVADTLLMPPSAYLNMLGLRVEARFLADTLRLAGLEAEVVAVSPYKSGGDQFTRATISPEGREQLERTVEQRYDLVVETVAAARNILPADVRALIDRAPLGAPAAVAAGLLDAALYEDELDAFLLRLTGGQEQPDLPTAKRLVLLDWGAATRRMAVPYRRRERSYIGLLSVSGAITAGPSRNSPLPLPFLGGSMAGSDSVNQALRRVERNKRVAALVLHIDSPGGDAFASDLIWREVLRVSRQKPVVVSMGNVAASGGYYIAACAQAIVAQPATITGSIGVYALRPNAAALFERARVGTTVISRGANSGLYSPLAPLSDDERETLRRTVFESYALFRERVRVGRGLDEAQLDPIAGGRVWSGAEAAQRGLVDILGGLPTAVARARELAKLPVDPHAPVLFFSVGGRSELAPQPFPSQPRANLSDWPALLAEALRPRLLAVLPWELHEV